MAFASLKYRKLTIQDHSTVHLIGVCHVSEESAQRVAEKISAIKPSKVLLEICEGRKDMLNPKLDEPAQPIPPLSEYLWAHPAGLFNPLFWLLEIPQLGIEAITGSSTAKEMRAAVSSSNLLSPKASIYFIDRPIQITVLRTLAKVIDSLKECSIIDIFRNDSESDTKFLNEKEKILMKKFSSMDGVLALLNASKLNDKDFKQLQWELETVIEFMVDGKVDDSIEEENDKFLHAISIERDRILGFNCHRFASMKHEANNSEIVAVVGAAHIPGIEKEWNYLTQQNQSSSQNLFDSNHRVYSEEYLQTIRSLYDESEPKAKISQFVKQSSMISISTIGGSIAAYQFAKYKGGRTLQVARTLRRVTLAWSFCSVTLFAIGSSAVYNEVRNLQIRRLNQHKSSQG